MTFSDEQLEQIADYLKDEGESADLLLGEVIYRILKLEEQLQDLREEIYNG